MWQSSIKTIPIKDIFSPSRIFRDRSVLRPSYVPNHLPHRQNEITRLLRVLKPAVEGTAPSNVFIYGLTGTGKTATVQTTIKIIEHVCETQKKVPPLFVMVNGRISTTNYRVLVSIGRSLGLNLPFTGLPSDEIYKRVTRALKLQERPVITVLDEIDFVVKNDKDILLYELTRLKYDLDVKVSLIGLSNDIRFKEMLDPRVVSSLCEIEMVFSPYTTEQLYDILKERAEMAFYSGVVDDPVLWKCAALAARVDGDARRALNLLRVAGEIAEEYKADKVIPEHVDRANERISMDLELNVIRKLPAHDKIVLAALYNLVIRGRKAYATSGALYDEYVRLCKKISMKPFSHRQMINRLNVMGMSQLVSSNVVSLGRGGRTRQIRLKVSRDTLRTMLKEDNLFRQALM